MKEIFYIAKIVLQKKLKISSLADQEKLEKFSNTHSFYKNINFIALVDRILEKETINKEQHWKVVLLKSQKRQKKQLISLSKKDWRKMAAAVIIVGLLISGHFLRKNLSFNSSNAPTIIVSTIKKGSDKATLTLEDGSEINLKKKTAFYSKNAKSNGTQIVYNTTGHQTTKIAYNYLTIPRGGHYFIILSDGTKVWLNAESKLKYPVSFIEGETRQVELIYGEAYFDVSPNTNHKGASFKVYTGTQELEVFGTEFNIKAYLNENNIYTTLVEGKVAVENGSVTQNLSPGQQSILSTNNKNIVITSVDVYDEISWKKGFFSFKNKSLKEIMIVLSRWYDVEVTFLDKDLQEVKFRGVLSKNQNLEDILTTIKKTNFINAYEIDNKRITLK